MKYAEHIRMNVTCIITQGTYLKHSQLFKFGNSWLQSCHVTEAQHPPVVTMLYTVVQLKPMTRMRSNYSYSEDRFKILSKHCPLYVDKTLHSSVTLYTVFKFMLKTILLFIIKSCQIILWTITEKQSSEEKQYNRQQIKCYDNDC